MEKKKKHSLGLLPWALCFFGLGFALFLFGGACRFSGIGFCGVGLALGVYWLIGLFKRKHPQKAKILKICFSVLLCAVILVMSVTLGFIIRSARGVKEADCQYLLVLGAGVDGENPSLSLLERLGAAHNYLKEYPEAKCIVSGGQGDGENLSEAQCMYNWLIAHGIDPDRIIMEDQASSTQENLEFSLALLEKMGEKPDSLAIVSSEYHLFRAELMAKRYGVTPLGVPAKTGLLPLRVNYYFREIFGVWYFLLFGQ